MHGSVMDGSSERAPCRAGAVTPHSRTMKMILGALLVVVLVLAAVALERTFTFRSRQPQAAAVAVEPLDTAALAQRLAGALRFKTVSYQDSTQFDARESHHTEETNLGRCLLAMPTATGASPTIP